VAASVKVLEYGGAVTNGNDAHPATNVTTPATRTLKPDEMWKYPITPGCEGVFATIANYDN
jgi:hypothetical protein